MTCSELEQLMVDLGEKPFHGRQIYKWIYNNRVFDFNEMSDLRRKLRSLLIDKCCICLPEVVARQKSGDGTEKFLFEGLSHISHGEGDSANTDTQKKNLFESVLIEDENSGRMTLCVSSQSGCSLKCRFCATGYLGYVRDLTVGEIVGQPLVIRRLYGDNAFDNLVFMGMGEPLLNYENVMASIEIMTDSAGLMLGAKKITVSTAGVAPGIRKLAASGSKVKLALSLNAANDRLRRQLMPIARSYPLDEVMAAVKEWTAVRKRRVSFEYILFKGINDGDDDAMELARLVQGIPCKINLLAYNPINGVEYERPDDEDVDRFAKLLYPRTPAVTVRKSRGRDIAAACGQLAGKKGYR